MSLGPRALRILMVVLVAALLSLPAAAGAQTVNGIKTPSDGSTVGGVVDVAGYADTVGFARWQLDLLPNGNPDLPIWLAIGTKPGAFTYRLNTAPFPAGPYSLRLRVVKLNSNYDEYFSKLTFAPKPATPAPSTVITGIVWQWMSVTNQTTKKTDTVPIPRNYTITFNTDGTLNGKADCNNFTGTYTQTNGFSIELGASTRAFCGEASLDTKYLSLLSEIAAGGPDGQGNLALETAGGEQRMLFKNGGPTKAAVVENANGIKTPADGSTVGGIVVVAGYANSPDFKKWQLDLLPGGNADRAVFLAAGTGTGAFKYDLNTAAFPPGEHALRLRVVRQDGNYDEYVNAVTFAATPTKETVKPATVAKAAVAEAAAENINGIITPKDGSTIGGTVVVKGYANSVSFMKWQLDLVPSGIKGVVPIFLTVGTTPGEFTYNLATDLFPPGAYDLRLRVVHENSNYDEYFTRVTIAR